MVRLHTQILALAHRLLDHPDDLTVITLLKPVMSLSHREILSCLIVLSMALTQHGSLTHANLSHLHTVTLTRNAHISHLERAHPDNSTMITLNPVKS